MRGSRKFGQRGGVEGPNLVTFSYVVVFLVDEGKGGYNYNFKRSTMTFRWHTDDDPTLNAGLVILYRWTPTLKNHKKYRVS